MRPSGGHVLRAAAARPTALLAILVLLASLMSLAVPQRANAVDGRRVGASTDPVLAAIDVSKTMFEAGQAAYVLIGRDDLFADSLAGTPLAGVRAPILYTTGGPDKPIRQEALAEVRRVLGTRQGCGSGPNVFILGGLQAVSAQVERTLADAGYCIHRFSGASRVETSVAIANYVIDRDGRHERVLLARSDDWADAITGGAYAAATGTPLVLTGRSSLHNAPAAFIRSRRPTEAVLLGGSAALSPDVEQQTSALVSARRVFGSARDMTAVAIALELWDAATTRGRVVVNGYDPIGWTYALSGAVLAARDDSPVVFSQSAGLSGGTRSFLETTSFSFAVIIGPRRLVSDQTMTEVGSYGVEPDPARTPTQEVEPVTEARVEAGGADTADGVPRGGTNDVELLTVTDTTGWDLSGATRAEVSYSDTPELAVIDAAGTVADNDAYWTEERIAGAAPTPLRPDPASTSPRTGELGYSSTSDPAYQIFSSGYMAYSALPTSVGRLYYTMPSGQDNVCSATVVARNLILTALHCAFTIVNGATAPAGYANTNFRFVPDMYGYWSNAKYGVWTGTAASHVYYYPQAFANYNSFYALEYALIEVPPTTTGRYIGDMVGMQKVLMNTHQLNLPRYSMGYPAEGVFTNRCSAAYCEPYFCYAPGGARHLDNGWYKLGQGCNTNGGSSGGPIFEWYNGGWWLASVNSHGSWSANGDRTRYWIVNMWGPSMNDWYLSAWNQHAVR